MSAAAHRSPPGATGNRKAARPDDKGGAPRAATHGSMFPPKICKALTRLPGLTIEPGWGAGSCSARHKGKMFLLLVRDELVFKLPKARVDALVAEAGGRRFDPRKNGRLMKEWVVLSFDVADGARLAVEAYRFTAGAR